MSSIFNNSQPVAAQTAVAAAVRDTAADQINRHLAKLRFDFFFTISSKRFKEKTRRGKEGQRIHSMDPPQTQNSLSLF